MKTLFIKCQRQNSNFGVVLKGLEAILTIQGVMLYPSYILQVYMTNKFSMAKTSNNEI